MRRSRLHSAIEMVVAVARSLYAAVTRIVGFDECVVSIALTLVTYGLWPDFGVRALVVPGAVLLWIALPPRAPLVHRAPAKPDKPAMVRRA